MSDDTQDGAPEKAAEETKPSVDLSSLKDLSFGPSWTTGKPVQPPMRHEREHGDDRRPPRGRFEARQDRRGGFSQDRRQGGFTSDRRPGGPRGPRTEGDRPPRREGDERSRGPRFSQDDRRGPGRFGPPRSFEPPVFKPTVEVMFYPEDSAFRALTKAIRNACRTYELFEVAHLILEKPERFVAVLTPLPARGGEIAVKLFQSVPDGLVFETEEAAVAHVCKNHLDRFFTVEEIEIEAPKGSFVGVNKSTLSGELIAPPNYHRYQELLRAHHAERYAHMSFERFAAQIELDKNPDSVNAWLEKMKKSVRYTVKDTAEGETAPAFDGVNAARAYLLSTAKDKIVRETTEARLPGRQLDQLPQGALRRSVEFVLEQQRRFPLVTANNLRGRLRRMKFGLYKRGSKGVSFVCAVKRRFRDEQTVFAKNLQELIDFIEKHPNVFAKELPEKFLGIVPEAPAAEKAPLQDATVTAESQETVEPSSGDAQEPAVAPEAAPAPAAVNPNAERLSALLKDLHWLVSEGFVTEFGDGRLFAPPPMAAAKLKQVEAEAAAQDKADAAEEAHEPAEAEAPLAKVEATLAVPAEPLETPEPTAAEDAPEYK